MDHRQRGQRQRAYRAGGRRRALVRLPLGDTSQTCVLLLSRPSPRAWCPQRAAVVSLSTTNTHRRVGRSAGGAGRVRRASHRPDESSASRPGPGSQVRFQAERAGHDDTAAEHGDPLAGDPPGVDDPAAGDRDARRRIRPAVGCTSSWQASSCSVSLTRSRPTARQPPGTQASRSDRKVISGKAWASRKPGLVSTRSSLFAGADRARPRGQQCRQLLDWLADDGPAGQRQASRAPAGPAAAGGKRRMRPGRVDPPAADGQPRQSGWSGTEWPGVVVVTGDLLRFAGSASRRRAGPGVPPA